MFSLAVYRKVVLFHSKLWILHTGCKKKLVPDSYLDLVSLELFRSMPLFSKVQKKKKNQRNAEQAKPIICKTT